MLLFSKQNSRSVLQYGSVVLLYTVIHSIKFIYLIDDEDEEIIVLSSIIYSIIIINLSYDTYIIY